MKSYFLVCLLILFVTPAIIQAQHYSSESDIARAVNVALSQLIVSQSYAVAIYEYGMNASLIEPCHPSYGYPDSLVVPNNTLRACRDTIVGPPWIFDNGTAGFYVTLGNSLIAQLNNYYHSNLQIQFVDVSITQDGYFTSLSDAINSGQCDIGISSMAITVNREQYVDFGCAHSATWMAIMRGGLDPNMTLTNLSQLNNSDVLLALLKGSAWLRIAAENCPMAQIVQLDSFYDCLDAVKNEEVQATFLHDVVIKYWLNQNSCPVCQRYKFGSAPLQFGIFFKKGALTGGNNSTSDAIKIPNGSSWLLFSAILAFIVNLF
jgi:ABC-type amino acid transport substrate-binding protein